MESSEYEMTIENLKQKSEAQATLIKELTRENEELFHQYNHLIIRNGKLLKRVDDYQKIISDLHIRIEELQLINNNMMQLNDNLRKKDIRFNLSSGSPVNMVEKLEANEEPEFDLDDLYNRWKNFPGQVAQNEPNLRKQVLMLVHLYNTTALRASELFNLSGVGGVTGARYVSTLKKYELIRYTGARKKGKYEITSKGYDFIKDSVLQKATVKENTAF